MLGIYAMVRGQKELTSRLEAVATSELDGGDLDEEIETGDGCDGRKRGERRAKIRTVGGMY